MTPRRVFLAVWDFVVGDDWRLALDAVVAIGLTALVGAWWLAPLIALGVLWWTLRGVRVTITQCDTSASDLPTQDSSSSPALPRAPSTDTR